MRSPRPRGPRKEGPELGRESVWVRESATCACRLEMDWYATNGALSAAAGGPAGPRDPRMAHDCGTRLVEACGEVIHCVPRRCSQACIRADAGTWLGGLLIRW